MRLAISVGADLLLLFFFLDLNLSYWWIASDDVAG
jgi:hypothetical protein